MEGSLNDAEIPQFNEVAAVAGRHTPESSWDAKEVGKYYKVVLYFLPRAKSTHSIWWRGEKKEIPFISHFWEKKRVVADLKRRRQSMQMET